MSSRYWFFGREGRKGREKKRERGEERRGGRKRIDSSIITVFPGTKLSKAIK
jgi:hypothetical protein